MEPNEHPNTTSAAESPERGDPDPESHAHTAVVETTDTPEKARSSAPPPLPSDEGPTRSTRRLFLPAVFIALLVATVLVESVLLFRSGSDERARTEAFDTSRRFLVRLTTYNSSTLDAQRREVLELATGRFRTEYTQLTGPDFIAALRDRQADSKGTVSRLAVTSLEGDNANVLAIVEVSVTNKDLPAPNVERNVIELSLVRTGSGWRVDAVSILGTLP